MFAPYMAQHGYECGLIIANNAYSQSKWLQSNNIPITFDKAKELQIVKTQIDSVAPDVLYLSDPTLFDSKFVNSLSCKPKLVVGWRAADIPERTDWSRFDVILSGLAGIRKIALDLGAKSVENFVPGFPQWTLSQMPQAESVCDVAFVGSWTTDQHAKRNHLLTQVARASQANGKSFTCRFCLNNGTATLPAEVANCNHGPRFGMEMYHEMRSGK